MLDNKKNQFPFYIRRMVYFFDTFFRPGDYSKLVQTLYRDRWDLNLSVCDPYLDKAGHLLEYPQAEEMYYFLQTFFQHYTKKEICKAAINIHKYMDIQFPDNFKLYDTSYNYLEHEPVRNEAKKLLETIYKR